MMDWLVVPLSYPFMQRVFPDERRNVMRAFGTEGVSSPFARLRAATFQMTAGNCIYGLFRASALAPRIFSAACSRRVASSADAVRP